MGGIHRWLGDFDQDAPFRNIERISIGLGTGGISKHETLRYFCQISNPSPSIQDQPFGENLRMNGHTYTHAQIHTTFPRRLMSLLRHTLHNPSCNRDAQSKPPLDQRLGLMTCPAWYRPGGLERGGRLLELRDPRVIASTMVGHSSSFRSSTNMPTRDPDMRNATWENSYIQGGRTRETMEQDADVPHQSPCREGRRSPLNVSDNFLPFTGSLFICIETLSTGLEESYRPVTDVLSFCYLINKKGFNLTITGAYAVRSERAGLNSPIHLIQAGLKQKDRKKKRHCPKEERREARYYDSDIAANALPISAQSNDNPQSRTPVCVCVCRSAAHAPPPLDGRRPVGTNISVRLSIRSVITVFLFDQANADAGPLRDSRPSVITTSSPNRHRPSRQSSNRHFDGPPTPSRIHPAEHRHALSLTHSLRSPFFLALLSLPISHSLSPSAWLGLGFTRPFSFLERPPHKLHKPGSVGQRSAVAPCTFPQASLHYYAEPAITIRSLVDPTHTLTHKYTHSHTPLLPGAFSHTHPPARLTDYTLLLFIIYHQAFPRPHLGTSLSLPTLALAIQLQLPTYNDLEYYTKGKPTSALPPTPPPTGITTTIP
ncbi:uncharacterized protein CLUP02_09893 [Colletotrichum lupini]|uniref:Uncharacterized protein n=1 Tax=Colletotrichum lupini TaxID=145971 RepID=A0A9Q8WID5_9PEZI|nr:uncharacterized protein CLUP02_09893 [Colletotrichum lupini]UQC84396.1 hypothetical protein CLUP02_09893 [Colletotrichum lupini]